MPSLFDHKQTAKEKQRIKTLKTKIAKLEKEKKEREEAKIFKDAVEWRFEFPNLLDDEGNFEGFDIVIGNPPYVSAVTMRRSNEIKEYFKKRYPSVSGSYDLYTLFLLQGKTLLNSKGVYSWIIPNKFLIADYAKKTRVLLIENGLYKSLNVSSFNVFKGVGVYPIILTGNTKGINIGFTEFFLKEYSDLKNDILTPEDVLPKYSTLKDIDIKINSGSTGFQAQIVKGYVSDENNDNSIPFTVSGNVDKYIYNNTNVKFMKKTFTKAFINFNNEIAQSKWKFWNSPKIVVAGMTKEVEAVYVETPLALGVGIYGIYGFAGIEPYALTAILNSKYLTYYFKKKFKDKHLAGGYLAINKSTIEQFPIVKPKNDNAFSCLSEYIHKINTYKTPLNEYVPNSHIAETFEEVIDAMVFELYFPKEFEKADIHFIKYVERDFQTIEGKSPEEQKEIIHNAYQKLREKDNEIRNNLKEMKIELRDLLMPILTV